MTQGSNVGERLAGSVYDIELKTDVLVIGGSLSGSWAALAAVEEGASVIVAEKGYAGAAGPIAAGSVGAYFIKPDDPIQRDAMVNARMALAFGLADSRWGERILDQSYRNLEKMAQWGYKWPRIKDGREKRGGITPNVLAFLRQRLESVGVQILDHSPALELLVDEDGVAVGAAGVNRHTGETWRVRAGAVVVATGGTSFLSNIAGTRGNTGDGYLLAAEAGAEFSGMEFTGQYHIKPYDGTLSKGAYREGSGTLFDNNGKEVLLGRGVVNAILDTGAAWDTFAKVENPEVQELVLKSHYVSTQFFEDAGINPFKEKYRVDFVCEGSIRATGGLAIDDELSTTVPGLFASGDVTSREKTNGAGPPGGGPAAGWAIGAGTYAGQAAVRFARKVGPAAHSRSARPVGGAGLRPKGAPRHDIALKDVVTQVQGEMLPLDRNFYRHGDHLSASLRKFDGLWHTLREGLAAASGSDSRAAARNALRARETVALLAAARWMNASALERTETRGLHRRSDFPKLDSAQRHHLISGGLDKVWVRRKAVDPTAVFPEGLAA
ncbi:FAD-binding protein [Caballeronia sp. DA-9]|uniref:FAD-binding protein n=1 Tax=Caballeronia sp. DA-9 TaxID=3436237 RepID=UPI003F680B36